MTGHLVERSNTNTHIYLTCHDCDWHATVGYAHRADWDRLVALEPLVTLVRWAHQDPSLLANDAAGESVERSMWRRIRDYMTKGVAP